MRIVPPDGTRSIVREDGSMEDAFRAFVNQVSKLGIIIGTGSPEGIVDAAQTELYMDDAGAAGSVLYIKRDTDIGGDTTQGWILV